MFKVLLTSMASLLSFVAASGVSTNSYWMLYEPDLPESLRK